MHDRMFWSMVYHFQDLSTGLQQLFPNGDWSFIKARRRTMSAKAKANEENKELYAKLDKELGEDEPNDQMDVEDEEYNDPSPKEPLSSQTATNAEVNASIASTTTTITTTTTTTTELASTEDSVEPTMPWLSKPQPLLLTWY